MKKILIILLCCIAVIGIALAIFVSSLKEKYLLQAKIAAFTMEPEPTLCIYDSQTGDTEEVSPEGYAAAQGKDLFVVQSSGDTSEIIWYAPSGTASLLAKTQKAIWGQPVAVDDEVYVAAETEDGKEDRLYKCEDGELLLLSDTDLGGRHWQQPYPLCAGPNYLLFSARTEDKQMQIIRLDCATQQESVVLNGYDPVWKEVGKSFFYISEEDALCLYDMEHETSELICDTVVFWSLQGWNPVDQVLYVKYHPATPIGDDEIGINDAFYYLQTNKLLDSLHYAMLTGHLSTGFGFRFIDFIER